MHIEAPPFLLTAFLKGRRTPGEDLVVVIEGDGYAFVNSTQPSNDPTPQDPVGLEIAVADPAPRILALARPCQYLTEDRRGCEDIRYWTTHRFAPEVIAAVGQAIDLAKSAVLAGKVYLVGYSGGGALAVLAAAGRDDVAGLVTVAAPLDLAAWIAHHGLTPMSGSRDPAEVAAAVARIPQVHLAGSRDRTVPPQIVQDFVNRLPAGAPVRFVLVNVDHGCCWAERWPGLRDSLPLPR